MLEINTEKAIADAVTENFDIVSPSDRDAGIHGLVLRSAVFNRKPIHSNVGSRHGDNAACTITVNNHTLAGRTQGKRFTDGNVAFVESRPERNHSP